MGKFRALWRYIGSAWLYLISLTFSSFFLSIVNIGMFLLIGQTAATLAKGAKEATYHIPRFGPVTIALADVPALGFGIILLTLVVGLSTTASRNWYVNQFEYKLRLRIFGKYVRSDWNANPAYTTGKAQTTIMGSVSKVTALLGQVSNFCSASISLLTMLVGSFLLNPSLTGVAVILVAVNFLLVRPFIQILREYARRALRLSIDFNDLIRRSVKLSKELKAYNIVEPVIDEASRLDGEMRNLRFRASLVNQIPAVIHMLGMGIMLFGGLAVVLAVGVTDLAGTAAAGLMLMRALGFARTVQGGYSRVVQQMPHIEMLAEFEDSFPETAEGRERLDGAFRNLRFEAVGFTYPGGAEALKSVDVAIERGQVIGIVGPSGAGKSTFVNIVLGLLAPGSGRLTVNDKPMERLYPAFWGGGIGYVPQDPLMFLGSVADNIRFYREGITDEQIRGACLKAGLDPDTLKQGLETLVGESGSQVSGGQRQRICIARALVGNPELMVFDEPSSSLDHDSEAIVVETLKRMHGEVTTLVITHRTRLLDGCTHNVRLEHGTVVESGPRRPQPPTDPAAPAANRVDD